MNADKRGWETEHLLSSYLRSSVFICGPRFFVGNLFVWLVLALAAGAQPRPPEQPIPFSHKAHAGDLKLVYVPFCVCCCWCPPRLFPSPFRPVVEAPANQELAAPRRRRPGGGGGPGYVLPCRAPQAFFSFPGGREFPPGCPPPGTVARVGKGGPWAGVPMGGWGGGSGGRGGGFRLGSFLWAPASLCLLFWFSAAATAE